jgi:excisionase family DNA binding protein
MSAKATGVGSMSSRNESGIPPLERISVRIPAAVEMTGLSRSRIYELMKNGEIEYVKVGSSTLIPTESLRRFIDSRRAGGPAAPAAEA